MEDNAITALRLAGDQAVGFGIWSLILDADPVVKAGAAGAGAGLALVVDRDLRQGLRARAACAARRARFERAFWSGAPLDDLYRRLGREADHPMAMLFAAAMEEWRDAPRPRAGGAISAVCCERIGKVMTLTLERELETLERASELARDDRLDRALRRPVRHGLGHHEQLPVDRADARTPRLAVVAPGIAEALFATALGLVAAIPAVVAYNKLSGDLDRYANRASKLRRRVRGGPVARAGERSRRASTAAAAA